MGSTSHFTTVVAVAAALQLPGLVPALAEEEKNAPPAQAPPPEVQTQPPTPDTDNRRFVFHRVDGSLLRLDMRTGAVATCSQTGADWTCVPSRDDRAALDRQIAPLRRDNAVLKNALLEHGVPLPDGMAAPAAGEGAWGGDAVPRPPQTVPPTASASPAPGASSRSTIDRIVDAVEKGWQQLVAFMTNLQRELQK